MGPCLSPTAIHSLHAAHVCNNIMLLIGELRVVPDCVVGNIGGCTRWSPKGIFPGRVGDYMGCVLARCAVAGGTKKLLGLRVSTCDFACCSWVSTASRRRVFCCVASVAAFALVVARSCRWNICFTSGCEVCFVWWASTERWVCFGRSCCLSRRCRVCCASPLHGVGLDRANLVAGTVA